MAPAATATKGGTLFMIDIGTASALLLVSIVIGLALNALIRGR